MTSIVRPFQAKPGQDRGITATNVYDLSAYDYRRRVGGEIRALREANGMTQKKVGDECGVSHNHVSDWETGRKMPGPNHFDVLMRIFGVSRQVLGRFLLRYTNP